MAKITFDKQHNVDVPTLLLQNRNFDTLGKINGACSLEYKENFNSADELSFTIYKTINGNENSLWDLIVNNKIVFIPEFQERFVISVSVNDDNAVSKTVTGISLCESELSQINLYNIEINTEGADGDIVRNGATIFYNESDSEHSLLHRLFEKAPHYSIVHVQDSLKNLTEAKTFSISDTDLYSELTNEIAQEFNCIFIFNSMDRTVSVYDLYNKCTCDDCGFRGDFSDKCPECGSTSFEKQYGEDTTVFISKDNLATQISLEPDMDSYKNCFYVEGGDDIINSALRSVNPNGSNYIYYFSNDILNDMPDSLKKALNDYNESYNSYNLDKEFDLGTTYCKNYNEVVDYIKENFKDDESITKRFNRLPDNGILVGYPSTTSYMYEATDLYYFLKSSMMPTINTEGEGLEDSVKNIVNGFANGFTDFKNEISVRNITSADRTSVERVIEKAAKLFYNTAYYTLDVNTITYARASSETSKGMWIGKFKLTSLTEYDDNGNKKSCESEQVNLSVSSNADMFIQQEIYRAVIDSQNFNERYKNVLSLKMDDSLFRDSIKYYSLDELYNLSDIFESCKDVLIKTKESSDMDDNLLDKYASLFNNRIEYINGKNGEIESRNTQLNYILEIYNCQNDDSVNSINGILNEKREEVNNELNIEKFIKESSNDGVGLWNTFCAYRREDKYSNSNYISDGSTDSEIVKTATQLFNVAQKELYKAGNIQYSISTTINNLLALKEFYPLKDKFSVGNWIRVGVNDLVYKLRLLSYKINFDKIESIDVEFSTVEKVHNGYSDVESVLKSASSIAGSYSGLVQQVSKTTSTTNKINNLVSNGLNATKTKYIDSDNEEIVIDNHGILGRKYDYVTNSYEPCQLKLLSNGIYLTSDNWENIHTGIGKISYFDPKKNKMVNDYGIIANTVIGKLLIGEELRIYGANNSITLDENGISLDGGNIQWTSQIKQDAVEGLSDNLSSFVKLIGDLQSQIDGEITSWFFDYEPANDNEPASNWKDENEKIKHEGDLFYNSATGRAYRYIYNNTLETHEWVFIIDEAITEALSVAKNAQDTADGKRRTFGDTPYPPYDKGDLWCQGSDGDLLVCINSRQDGIFDENDWQKAIKYTDDTALNEYKEEIAEFKNKVDNSLFSTEISEDYVISPKIGGGYLHISKEGCGSVIIDPYQSINNDYIFAVKDSSKDIVMGVNTSGNAFFSGELCAATGSFSGELLSATGSFSGDIKIGYTTNGMPKSPYNCIIDSDGLRIGVGNGGTTYSFKVESNGDITSYGNLLLANGRLTYDSKDGLALRNNMNILESGSLVFKESITADSQEEIGSISCDKTLGNPGLLLSGMNVRINASRSIILDGTGAGGTEINGDVYAHNNIYVDNNVVIIRKTTDTSTLSCTVSTNEQGHCVLTNNYGTIVAVMNNSFGVPSKDDGKVDLGRSNARWKDIYTSTAPIESSDKNLKSKINTLNEKYEQFFMKLVPVSFLFKDGDSGRTHIGFISQDVENAMFECGLTDLDFAGFCKDVKQEKYLDENGNESYKDVIDENGNPVYIYSLRYEEFIPLNTYMLQKCVNKINDLENKIMNLQGSNI